MADVREITLRNLRREALAQAVNVADAGVKRTGETLTLKLTDAARAHVEDMQTAYLHAAAELRRELSEA